MPSPIQEGKNAPDEESGVKTAAQEASIGEKIVLEARSWLHTPFEHQGKIKGVGVDCAQLIARTLVAVVPGYGDLANDIPTDYNPKEDGILLRRILKERCDWVEAEDRDPGDIMAFCEQPLDPKREDRNVPRHMVFLESITTSTTFVIDPTLRGVRRHRLDMMWWSRLHSIWWARVY